MSITNYMYYPAHNTIANQFLKVINVLNDEMEHVLHSYRLHKVQYIRLHGKGSRVTAQVTMSLVPR